jgi:trehalose 6-phosphate synthase
LRTSISATTTNVQFGIELAAKHVVVLQAEKSKGEFNLSLETISGGRLIVVSNRLPMTLRKSEKGWTTERSSGGLASAMNPLLRKDEGDWIGWAGINSEDEPELRRSILQEWADKDRCFAVDLPGQVATGFYEGYANQALWPVFHNFPSQLKFDTKAWEAYVEANRIFSEAVVARYQPNDVI